MDPFKGSISIISLPFPYIPNFLIGGVVDIQMRMRDPGPRIRIWILIRMLVLSGPGKTEATPVVPMVRARGCGNHGAAKFRAGPEKTFCTLDVQSREYMGMVK